MFRPQFCNRTQGGDEAEADDHCIRFQFFRFTGLFVHDHHFFDPRRLRGWIESPGE